MTSYTVQRMAGQRLEAIHDYSARRWGAEKADAYIHQVFDFFQQVARKEVPWRPVPAALAVSGYYARCGQHFVYWKVLSDGTVGIVTVLHERMHQLDQFRHDDI